MFTSDTEQRRRTVLRHAAGELTAALFCAAFGAVYEHFSFGVFSYYMIYSFVFPLAAGLVLLLMAMGKRPPERRFLNFFNSASATFAVGFIAAGVLRIYGTDSLLLKVYPVLGALMLLLAAYAFIADRKQEVREEQ